jgi:hypothetical protein
MEFEEASEAGSRNEIKRGSQPKIEEQNVVSSGSGRVGNSGSRVGFGSTRLTRLYKRVNPNPTRLLIGL